MFKYPSGSSTNGSGLFHYGIYASLKKVLLHSWLSSRNEKRQWISDGWGRQRIAKMVKGFDEDQLCEFCAEKGIEWKFTTPATPHQNGHVNVLSKGRWGASFGAIRIVHVSA